MVTTRILAIKKLMAKKMKPHLKTLKKGRIPKRCQNSSILATRKIKKNYLMNAVFSISIYM